MPGDIVSKIRSAIDDLPPMPQVASRLLREIENPDAEVRNIYEILTKDAALAGKILTIANSAYYSRGIPISSLPAAIRVLGFSTIRNVVMSIATSSMFSRAAKNAQKSTARLWKHSLGTAYLSVLISKSIGESYDDEIFVYGLLHDIGKIPVIGRFPEIAEKIEEMKNDALGKGDSDWSVTECEMRLLGFTHGQLGGALMEKWNFPDKIRWIVEKHHDYNSEDDKDTDILIVRLANFLSHKLQGEPSGERDFQKVSKILKIPKKQLADLSRQAAEHIDKDLEVFGI